MRKRHEVGWVILALLVLCMPGTVRSAQKGEEAKWDKVPPVDFSKINPGDFTDAELDLPHYLQQFHQVANSIIESGPDRGFIDAAVWRAGKDNKPYNARVMESHLTLAWFYTTKRPWNPYYGSQPVRQRLEAMLTLLCNMQNDDGRFSEYGPKKWNLPATAFATKFLGETITLLSAKDAPPIDPDLLKRVIEADRKAIMAVLTIEDLYTHGKSFSNQFTNVFAGAAAYLALFPDEKLSALLQHRFADATRDLQSACGYFYEANGPDFGYTLGTHHSNAHMAYFYLHGTPIGDVLEMEEKSWNEWLGYNLLRQPDGSTFVANRGVETRQKHASFDREDGNLAEKVPSARAFATSIEERTRNIAKARADLVEKWGGELTRRTAIRTAPSSSFSPYIFLHRRQPDWYPSDAQRDKAIAKLPYLARDRFIHQRMDSRQPAVYTFIRRPAYYACFNSGPPITSQQRLGLGLIWLPKSGTVMQTQTDSADHAWGTRAKGAKGVYESTDGARATFKIAGKEVSLEPGNHDLSDGELVVTYPLGKVGRKTITFKDSEIRVTVEHPGKFTEQIPLVIVPGAGEMLIVDRLLNDHDRLRVPGERCFGDSKINTTGLEASDNLEYRLLVPPTKP